MRVWIVLLLIPLAGCLQATEPVPDIPCDGELHEMTLYFAGGHRLQPSLPPSGQVPGNGFNEAFLTNDMDVWLSAPMDQTLRVFGDVEIFFWARNEGTPAPIVVGGDPGEGYHFFNQFGSDRTFQPAYAIEYQSAAPEPGSVVQYNETLAMPPGGFTFDRGDSARVLSTSLVMDGPQGRGHTILFGEAHPSRLTMQVECLDNREYEVVDETFYPVQIPGNQGLLSGAIPATEGLNQFTGTFTLLPGTERLTIELRQTAQNNPTKDDMDLVIVDAAGEEVWNAGSPYTDETAVLWETNLNAALPPGDYGARVNSYSGFGYEGELTIIQERIA